MMTMLKRPFLTTGLAGLLALAAVHAHAAQAIAEFGPSVVFDSNGPQPTLAKLKGKAVILLFFQSSDKASNGWSDKLIQEMQEAHGTNKTAVLIALKTDGGGLAAAKGYFTSKGANLDQWVVGSDTDARYSKDLIGEQLWYYVLVGADGTSVERGKAGVSHNVKVGANKTEKHYSLADPSLLKKCGKLTTVLPAGKSYAPAVSGLVRLAELGETEKALVLCTAALNKPKERPAAAELHADLQALVDKRLSDRAALLGDASKPSPARYEAFQELAQMAKDLKTLPAAAKINPLLSKARLDPALQKEARAESAYRSTLARLQKASARDKPRLIKELETLAQQNPETQYGQLAGESAKQLADSTADAAK